MDPQLLAALAAPVVTTALAALAALVREWRLDRQWEHKRRVAVAQAHAQVLFMRDWMEVSYRADATGALDTRREEIASELGQLYEGVSRQLAEADATRSEPERARSVMRTVLLRSVTRPAARVVRVVYLTYLWIFSLIGGLTVATSVIGTDEVAEYSLGLRVVVALFVYAFYLLPALALYKWALWLDRRQRSPDERTPRTAPTYSGPPPSAAPPPSA